jgi:hypothetical protein
MRSSLVSFIAVALLCSVAISARAQEPPCLPGYAGVTYNLPRLDSLPPGDASMPFDVMTAYWVINGVYNYNNKLHFYKFFDRRTTFDDTVKKMMHYYYKAVDWNPLLFKQSALFASSPGKIWISQAANKIEEAVQRTSPYSHLDYTLVRSSYILHIRTDYTVVTLDTAIPKHFPIHEVTATILDCVKGHVVPKCLLQRTGDRKNADRARILESIPEVIEQEADSGTCFRMHYAPSWGLKRPDNNDWMQAGREYIVFLDLIGVCDDSTSHYVSMRPAGPTLGIFPIENGEVVDPFNEFGFGQNLTPAQFKAALRQRIQTIETF